PNRAGNTTIVNLISGVTRADSGSIKVFGKEVVDLTPEYRAVWGVARSFQHARLFPGLTVTQTVQVALSPKNRVGFLSATLGAPWAPVVNRRSRMEALELLEALNLTPWANPLTSDLSTG